MKKNFGNMHLGWVVGWLVWSVATVVFVAVRVIPQGDELFGVLNSHPELLRDAEGWFAVVPHLLWFIMGVVALVVLQASVRRVTNELGLGNKP